MSSSDSPTLGHIYASSLSSPYIQEFRLPFDKNSLYNRYNRIISEDLDSNSENFTSFAAENEQSDVIGAPNKTFLTSTGHASKESSSHSTNSWLAHQSTIWQCLYIPSRRCLFSCSRDSLVKEWNLQEEEQVLVESEKSEASHAGWNTPRRDDSSRPSSGASSTRSFSTAENESSPKMEHAPTFGSRPKLTQVLPRVQKHWITCMEYIDASSLSSGEVVPHNLASPLLATGSDDKSVQIHRLSDRSRPFEDVLEMKCKSAVYALKSLDRGRKLVAGTNRGECFLYDLVKCKLSCRWKAHEDQITAFETHHNMLISSAQYDEKIRLWDLRVEGAANTSAGVMLGHTAPVWALKQHNAALYSAGADGSVCRWSWSNHEKYEKKFPKMHKGHVVYQLAPIDSKFMASAGDDQKIRFFNVTNGIQVGALDCGMNVHSIQFVPTES